MNNEKNLKYIRAISFLSFLSIFLVVATVVNAVKAERYRMLNELTAQRAISSLGESLDSITVNLEKGVYSNSEQMLRQIGTELYRDSETAKSDLSALTTDKTRTDEIYKFLSQVGDFTLSLTKSGGEKFTLSDESRQQMKKLFEYSRSLSQNVGTIRNDYFDGSVSFEEKLSTLSLSGDETVSFSNSVNDAQQSLTDFPTLVYDGPFADSVLNRDAVGLEDENEFTKNQAKEKAAEILGVKADELREDDDRNSEIELFCFSKSYKTIGITKKGGYLCYITNPDYAGEATISVKEAIKRGVKYLNNCGYKSMTDSYYSVYDGVVTVNYAYEANGILYYPDLIKVGIALDSGEIVSFDAEGYLMNHCKRKLNTSKVISVAKGKSKLYDGLTVLSCKKALIPLQTGKESLCLEYHCRDDAGQELLVYLNCETGVEENLLLLLYSDDGVLTR